MYEVNVEHVYIRRKVEVIHQFLSLHFAGMALLLSI